MSSATLERRLCKRVLFPNTASLPEDDNGHTQMLPGTTDNRFEGEVSADDPVCSDVIIIKLVSLDASFFIIILSPQVEKQAEQDGPFCTNYQRTFCLV